MARDAWRGPLERIDDYHHLLHFQQCIQVAPDGIRRSDFMGFVAASLPHNLTNPETEDLVYLVGGSRLPFDICDYPRIRKRRYRINGKSEFVSWELLEKAGR